MDCNFLQLGATLYVPANRPDLLAIANHVKYPWLRSIIFCFEDSMYESDIEFAMSNLSASLTHFATESLPRFIRVRNPSLLQRLLLLDGIDRVQGFVIPKATRVSLPNYMALLSPDSEFLVMPILETQEVFDTQEMHNLRRWMDAHPLRDRIVGLRIGGNDLLNLLHLRRGHFQTIYDTPIASAIHSLIQVFRPAGYPLAAPVFDGIDRPEVLTKEVRHDIACGLTTKSAIHPDQIRAIESQYAVTEREAELAKSILAADAPAVFGQQGAMCETATHANWARAILDRQESFGLRQAIAQCLPLRKATHDIA